MTTANAIQPTNAMKQKMSKAESEAQYRAAIKAVANLVLINKLSSPREANTEQRIYEGMPSEEILAMIDAWQEKGYTGMDIALAVIRVKDHHERCNCFRRDLRKHEGYGHDRWQVYPSDVTKMLDHLKSESFGCPLATA